MIWKFLNKRAQKEIEKLGYEKVDIGVENNYLCMKFIKNVNRLASDVVIMFIRSGHLCIRKNRIVYTSAKKEKIKFKSEISLNSNETVWFGIMLKHIESIDPDIH